MHWGRGGFIVGDVTGGGEKAARLPVFADVDTGVDDAMALVYLLASADADLVGIASTAGNVPVQQVCRNNLGLLELCQSHRCPGVQGLRATGERATAHRRRHTRAARAWGMRSCHRPTGSSPRTTPREAWVRAAHAYPGELVGVAIGPLTNLALALRSEPALPKLLRRLVIMGGAFAYRGNTTPVAEWNISVDPEAAAEVFAVWGAAWGLQPPKHIPIVLGLNLTENIAMTPTILSRLATAAESSIDTDERAG